MKTLILYTSKHGATLQIANQISSHLAESQVVNLKEKIPSLSEFDCIIIGSPLRAGKISKEVSKFARKNEKILKEKQLGLFLSGLDEKQEGQYFSSNFSPALLEKVKVQMFLGGIYDPEKCNLMERAAMQTAAHLTGYTSTISPDQIEQFVSLLEN